MAKHTQTIRRQQSINCLSVSDHFVGLALTRLMYRLIFELIKRQSYPQHLETS